MKLIGPAVPPQLGGNLVDALGDYQNGSVGGFCQEVSQRTVQAAGEQHSLAILGDDRKGSVDAENFTRVTSEQPASSLRFVDRPKPLGVLCDKVDDTRNRELLVHA